MNDEDEIMVRNTYFSHNDSTRENCCYILVTFDIDFLKVEINLIVTNILNIAFSLLNMSCDNMSCDKINEK